MSGEFRALAELQHDEHVQEMERLVAEGTVHKTQVEVSATSWAPTATCNGCSAQRPMLPDRVEFTPYLDPPRWVVTGHRLPEGWSKLQVADPDNPISPGGRMTYCRSCRAAINSVLGDRWQASLPR